MKEERTIVIKDLLFRILLKWRKIIICMLVFAVLANGFSCIKSYRVSVKTKEMMNRQKDVTQYESTLSTDQITTVKNAIATYLKYNKEFGILEEYCSNAVKMKIDYSKTPTMNFLYIVNNCDNIPGLISYINQSVFTKSWRENAVKQLDWDQKQATYILDLISIKQINEQTQNGSSSSIIVDDDNKNKFEILNIKIISLDEKSTRLLAGLVEEALKDKLAQIQKQYQNLTLELSSKSFVYEMNNELLNSQNSNFDNMNRIHSSINNLTYNFSDDQKLYFHALIDNLQNSNNKKSEPESVVSSIDLINVKYIFLGLVLGGTIAVCSISFVYIFGKKLRTSVELVNDYHIPLLGEIASENEKKKNKIDNIIYYLFQSGKKENSYEERLDMICTGIKIAVTKQKMRTLYITSTSNSTIVTEFKEKILELLKKENINVMIGKSIVHDPVSLERLSVADGVVFVEQINNSLMNEIEYELEICNKYDVFIIGSIVLQ